MAKVALQDRTRRNKETLPELAGDIDALVRKAYPSGNEQMWGDISLRLFRSGTDKHGSKTAGENAGAHHTT